MKKILLYSLLLASVGLSLTSCSEDKLSDQSVIATKTTSANAFDKWLEANFVVPYNIEFQYRYEDNESDMQYYDVPADSAQSVKLAHIVKYTCVEAYDRVAGIEFTRTYFPKMFSLLGEFEYDNSGTMKLGTAEGGKKIRLLGVNHLERYITDRANLNELYLKTIHHEFVHIVNQTKDYPREFDQVTPLYVSDTWSTPTYLSGYLTRGFITAYSQKEGREDFAEMVSTYVISTPEEWQKMLDDAVVTTTGANGKAKQDTSGRDAILKKLEICKKYYTETYHMDLDKLRDEVVRRENDVIKGNVNLTDLTVTK